MVSVILYILVYQAPAFWNSREVTLCYSIADVCYAVQAKQGTLNSNVPPAFVKISFTLVHSLGVRKSDGQKERWSIRGPALRSIAEEEEIASGACITTHKNCNPLICDDAMPHTRVGSWIRSMH